MDYNILGDYTRLFNHLSDIVFRLFFSGHTLSRTQTAIIIDQLFYLQFSGCNEVEFPSSFLFNSSDCLYAFGRSPLAYGLFIHSPFYFLFLIG